jgi:hypothetical protein
VASDTSGKGSIESISFNVPARVARPAAPRPDTAFKDLRRGEVPSVQALLTALRGVAVS